MEPMTLKLIIEFSPLNINVNVIPSGDEAVIAQVEALQKKLNEAEAKLTAALNPTTT